MTTKAKDRFAHVTFASVASAWAGRVSSSFFVCVLVYLLFLAPSRIAYFVDYFAFWMEGDYGSYAQEGIKLSSGAFPDFSLRPPLYPIFLAVCAAAGLNASGILLLQTIISTLCGVAFLWAAHRWRPQWTWIALIALLGSQAREQWLEYESELHPDSIFASLQLLFVAALMLLAKTGRARWAFAASLCAALAILARPVGIVLLVVEILLVVFILFRGLDVARHRLVSVLIIAPTLAALIGLTSYNYAVSKRFEFSVWGEMNLAGAVMFMWRSSPSFPDEMNADIERIQSLVAPEDLAVIRSSWNPDELYGTFYSTFRTYLRAQRFFPTLVGGPSRYTVEYYLLERPAIRVASREGILTDPATYAKFVGTNLWAYFLNYQLKTHRPVSWRDFDDDVGLFTQSAIRRKAAMLARRDDVRANGPAQYPWDIGEEIVNTDADFAPNVVVTKQQHPAEGYLKPTAAGTVHSVVDVAHAIVFRNILWMVAFIASTAIMVVLMLRRSADFLVLGACWLMFCGSALLTSLIEISLARYTVAALPQFYFSAAFSGAWLVNAWLNRPREQVA